MATPATPTVNNGSEIVELFAGATLTILAANVGAIAQVSLITSDAPISFSSAVMSGGSPLVIGPFAVNAQFALSVSGKVAIDVRLNQGSGGGSGNIDGGTPSSNYGAVSPVDGGTP